MLVRGQDELVETCVGHRKPVEQHMCTAITHIIMKLHSLHALLHSKITSITMHIRHNAFYKQMDKQKDGKFASGGKSRIFSRTSRISGFISK